jgi:hypothetical protein
MEGGLDDSEQGRSKTANKAGARRQAPPNKTDETGMPAVAKQGN